MLGLPDVAVGAIIAALIAGTVSLLGLILGKEQKISEFRQAWIDALRDEISGLISHANAIYEINVFADPDYKEGQPLKDAVPHYAAINKSEANIRLRLNLEEVPSRNVIATIEEIGRMLAPGQEIPDYRDLDRVEKRLVGETNVVLKKEWKRVKRGEPVFVTAKYTSLAVVLCTLTLGVTVIVWPEFVKNLVAFAGSKS